MPEASLLIAVTATIAAAAFDARTGYIPDYLSGVAAFAVVAVAARSGTLAGACAGSAAVAGLLFVLFAATRGRGLGFGDVKLGVVIGAGCGVRAGIIALGAAFVLGAVYAVPMLLSGAARRGDAVAFAPFLAAGTVVGAVSTLVAS